jgi:hypothetical protein
MVSGVPKWYDARKEAGMIELTEQQVEALKHAEATPRRESPDQGDVRLASR